MVLALGDETHVSVSLRYPILSLPRDLYSPFIYGAVIVRKMAHAASVGAMLDSVVESPDVLGSELRAQQRVRRLLQEAQTSACMSEQRERHNRALPALAQSG